MYLSKVQNVFALVLVGIDRRPHLFKIHYFWPYIIFTLFTADGQPIFSFICFDRSWFMFILWSLDEAHFLVSGRPLGQIMVSWPAHSFPVIDLLAIAIHFTLELNGVSMVVAIVVFNCQRMS